MLTIVMVHYDTAGLLRQCLGALLSAPAGVPYEAIVIDNASPDATVRHLPREFPGVRFRFNRRNLGFARAVNQGIRMGTGRHVLVLNPDTIVRLEDLGKLVAFMDVHPDAGACGPRLVYPDGGLQLSCRRFPTLLALGLRISRLDRLVRSPVRHYLMAEWDHSQIRDVDWIIGGCMALRREAIEQIGLLDEGFFMYYEDIDLCHRLHRKGWKVYYNPEVTVVHHHQRTSASLLPNRLSYLHARSLIRLIRKHRPTLY